MEPIVEPLELTPSVSSSSKVTMISRFPDCKLSDRKAGSKGISADSNCTDSLFTILLVEILIVCKSTDIWFREQQAYGNLVQYSYCMVIDSPCFSNKELTTPEQMATGKEISNPFLADSLLKTIRLSLHLVIATKH
ncbi:hypothetical protein Tco_0327582 [Tanacetum coccineum]